MESETTQRGSKTKKMKKVRQYFFIILLALAAGLLGYNYFYRPFEVAQTNDIQMGDKNPEINEQIKNTPEYILSKLSTQEKVSQLIASPVVVSEYFAPEEQASDSAQLSEMKTGFYTLFGKEISATQAQEVILDIRAQNAVLNVRPYIAVDHEGGSVQRLSGQGFTKLVSWKELCALETVDRKAALKQSANELRKVSIDIVFAPVLDVGANAVLKDRICSADSYAIVADRSMDYVTIFANVGIMPVLKHFPGIGLTKKDLHKDYDFVSVLENDVKLYKYIIDQNKRVGVMTAHVGVTSQDKEIPCSVSPYCVSELNKAYPNILVFTDALEMSAALYDFNNPKVPKSLTQVSKEAVLAGNNVLVYGQSVAQEDLSAVITELSKEYESNPALKALVDKSVLKIIEYKVL